MELAGVAAAVWEESWEKERKERADELLLPVLRSVPADALAGLLGVAAKDVAAMCSKLIDDRLICVHRRAEVREGFGARAVQ